ncbi:hypothetical protein [Streptomyces iconiensis]|uniref:Uncharacterized protein n=1 Tax=Streptomyces iconiensis TaxID=1384038 RepID=A0ABT7A0V9_9ACTN|nr:hypothetical protein [Streptomyces iconiensis]MDJ1134972.1 hypothetical protein [Streptomyces iconiensis]
MRARTYGQALRALACGLMAWQVWLVFRVSAYDAVMIDWSCDSQGCGSDDFASAAPLLGGASVLALGFLAARFLHRATPGCVVALAALANVSGWREALDEGRAAEGTRVDWPLLLPFGRLSVAQWLTSLWVITAVAVLCAVWGAAFSVRRTAAVLRYFRGRATAEAELSGWQRTGRGRGAVTVRFEDGRGVAYEVPTVVEMAALGRPVLAVYDEARPEDPATTRVAIPRKRFPQ